MAEGSKSGLFSLTIGSSAVVSKMMVEARSGFRLREII